MYKITQQNRDAILRYLDNSNLPHADVKALCQMLMALEPINPAEAPAPAAEGGKQSE